MCGILLLALALIGLFRSGQLVPALIALAFIIIAAFGMTDHKQNGNIEIIDSSPSFYSHIHVVRINDQKNCYWWIDNLEQDFTHRVMLLDAGKPRVEPLELVAQASVIDAQAVQDRGVEIVDVDRVFSDVVAELVRFPIN
jgi:hypothetical protein